ncbi:zinc metallopeptidase [bacterium]|nr:zinc metallopeptidase [bacterium]
MRWRSGRRSSNVEDRRGGRTITRPAVGGGLGLIVIVGIALLMGVDPRELITVAQVGQQTVNQGQTSQTQKGPNDELADFVSVVLADLEDTWTPLFRKYGGTYQQPKLVIFDGAVQSACGFAQAATGPFYCPGDYKVYIDLEFYRELRERFKAPGDFAQAYVIAHEVGHHVQNLMGTLGQVQQAQQRVSKTEANQLLVRLELQADCYAGIWAHHADKARQILEDGDIDEALNAASCIGDDRIQRQTQGYVVPDSFTHGTSEQRSRWFMTGLKTGDLGACDTFQASRL